MFELSVACKYLVPRWRQLSVSIISLVSTLVIALVVWLIIVFFSVKDGLEKSWIDKLIALTAPVRITPTEKYYHSYYYLADSISSRSDYTLKTIAEKLQADTANPYDPDADEELPKNWAAPDLNSKGEVKDLVKLAYQTASKLPGVKGLKVADYEMTVANLKLKMLRWSQKEEHPKSPPTKTQQYIEQAAYLGSFDPDTTAIAKTLLPLSTEDIQNLVEMKMISSGDVVDNAVVLNANQSAPFARTAKDNSGIILGEADHIGEAILLPRSFKDGGALVGDHGFLTYYSPTPSSIQEQRMPVYVAGFYDPGIMPMGGKFILAGRNLTAMIRASHNQEEALVSNGFNMRFDHIADAPKIKAALVRAFQREGIDPYWNVETYQEFEFTKDLIQQLHSEKNLFSLISIVIIIVACSNIISMLIILVNDKKIEIGILRSMGATSKSIAAIFGLCGMVMGAIGSIVGIIAAIITLHNLESLVHMISRIQGYDLFNPVFYGNTLPNEISLEVLGSVVLATALISLLAGIVPAVKASLLRPSTILRSE